MPEDSSFRDLIRRVRAGDAEASAALVRQYESAIRLAVHVRLTDPGLRRLLDSTDICQSVLVSFFLRVSAGQYELDTPGQLLKLLTTMARNKLLNQAEHHRSAGRDHRRVQDDGSEDREYVDPGASPSEVVSLKELREEFRRRLSEEEQQLAELRAGGHSWKEIAAALGGDPNTLRMRLQRACDRITNELGLQE